MLFSISKIRGLFELRDDISSFNQSESLARLSLKNCSLRTLFIPFTNTRVSPRQLLAYTHFSRALYTLSRSFSFALILNLSRSIHFVTFIQNSSVINDPLARGDIRISLGYAFILLQPCPKRSLHSLRALPSPIPRYLMQICTFQFVPLTYSLAISRFYHIPLNNSPNLF